MQQYHKCGVQYSLDIFSKIDNLTELRTLLVEEVLKQEFQIFDRINAFRKNSSANSIGVDLGTTYCCVAVHRNNRTEVIPNTMGKYTTPSYVALHDDQPFVGEVAKSSAHEHPQSTLFDMKRMLGKRIYDLNILQSKKYWPFDITEKDGQVKLKCGPEKMFKPEDVIAMIERFASRGGTFDVAVLEIQGNCIKIRAIDGDPNIGGEDFDNEMVQHCIQEFMKEHGIDLGIRQCNEDSSALARRLRRLKSHCEEQKCNLSATKHVVVSIDGIIGSLDLKVAFSRELFSSLIESYLRTCMSTVDRAIFSSEVKYGDITQIVMVGGSSRIPKVQEMLEQRFGRKALCKQVNADEAVAAGAAILASYFDEPSKSRITTEELEMVLLN
ncbi:unnamed protein product [Allacma fusca]|uniref:Heat shock protein 70 n=1 Tax=Allacma fusca TaxID=39272 RepID=A0A8J2JW66_9HEXA|nr:unnamed protein product [Allacma fusca]